MRKGWCKAAAFAAVLMAGATVSSPVLSADPYGPAGYYDATPVPSQDVFEGWYLGGTIGGASVSYDMSPASPSSVDSSGVLGGMIGGYSWQHGPFVLGVEGDFLATDIDGSRKYNGGLNKVSPGIDTMADLRLRAGYAIKENVLLFGTFGGAWANADLPISGPGGGFDEATFFGWSVGGGAEVALNPKWSARFDYQYTDFDAETASYPGGNVKIDPDANTFRGSVIYHF